jgi:fatty acid-binding protein DegV
VEEAAREAGDRSLRVGVGHGAAPEIAAALRQRIAQIPAAAEIIDYVVGPVIGAHTGAGTAGAVFVARPV